MSKTTDTPTSDGHAEKRRRYESLLRTIEYNTGGPTEPSPQPALAPEAPTLATVARGQWSHEGARRSLKAAVSNGDVLRVHTDGARLSLTAESALRAVIAEQNCSESPDTSLIERAAALL